MLSNNISTQYDYVFWTDGGGNVGNGSWAYGRVVNEKMEYIIAGKKLNTTNNRMEMFAVINAIKSAKAGSKVKIFTDSSYVKKGFHDPSHLQTWTKNGWKTSNKKPVKNQDLWEEMIKLSLMYSIRMELVPGHSGIEHNESVDRACTWVLKNFDEIDKEVYYDVKSNKYYDMSSYRDILDWL